MILINHQTQYRIFETKINGIEIFVTESQMSDEVLVLAEKIVQEYPLKNSIIAGDFKDEFADMHHRPRIVIKKMEAHCTTAIMSRTRAILRK